MLARRHPDALTTEQRKDKRGSQFTMKAVQARLDSGREPWAAFAGSRRGLSAAGKRLARLER